MKYSPICVVILSAGVLCHATPAVAQRQLPPLTGPVEPTGETPAATGWQAVEVVAGLEHPWAIVWMPDEAALITERPGRLRLLSADGRLHPEPIAGVPPVFAQRQGGLLDVALHPDFSENRFVYLAYAHGTNAANHTRIARARLEEHALKDLEVIFETQPAKRNGFHFGCRMLFLKDGSLLFAIGGVRIRTTHRRWTLTGARCCASWMMDRRRRTTRSRPGSTQRRRFILRATAIRRG